MDPKAKLKKIFLTGTAIYVTDDFVDIAKGDRTAKGIKLTFLQRYPILQHIKETPYTDAREGLDNILEKAFPDADSRPYRVAVNIRNDSCILRQFSLRGVADKEIRNAIIFEAQKYMPYSVEDLVYGFRTCAKHRDSREVMFAAAEKKNVNMITDYFESKNILPSIVEATPALMARALSLDGSLKKDGAYLSIHYEPANKAVITGICYRQPHFFREIRIFPGDDEFKTAELSYLPLKDVWMIIERDVIGSVEYLRKETKKGIEKIFISGFTRSPEEQSIAKEFGTPFERIDASFIKDITADNADRHIPALALLYDSLNTPSLNLAPLEVTRKDLWALKPIALGAAAAFFLIIAAHLLLLPVVSSEQRKITEIKKTLEAFKDSDVGTSASDIQKYKELMESKASFAEDTIRRISPLTVRLKQIGRDITKDSWLERILYKNTVSQKANLHISLSGYINAAGEAGVSTANAIVQNLLKDQKIMAGFREAKLASVEKANVANRDLTKFEIILK